MNPEYVHTVRHKQVHVSVQYSVYAHGMSAMCYSKGTAPCSPLGTKYVKADRQWIKVYKFRWLVTVYLTATVTAVHERHHARNDNCILDLCPINHQCLSPAVMTQQSGHRVYINWVCTK